MEKQILVTGGAGFIGSHLVERLIEAGHRVWVVDNFITGSKNNVAHLAENERFRLIEADVSGPPQEYLPEEIRFNEIYHLASPASPRGYQDKPVETYSVNAFGTHHLAGRALRDGAVFLFASTSEVYGDPQVHPQKEDYNGNVHIRGIRSCYDVSKRFGEMVQTVWEREKGLDIRTVRIFNTYGPRMDPRDGRVFPNFISQALKNEPITVYGDGSQTRSFCYVSDLVGGMIQVMESHQAKGKVYNLGNPEERTILEMAETIKRMTGATAAIEFLPLPQDDPTRRKPDIGAIQADLGWQPQVGLEAGLDQTIGYFRKAIGG